MQVAPASDGAAAPAGEAADTPVMASEPRKERGLRAACRRLARMDVFERSIFAVVIINAIAMASEDVPASAANVQSDRNDVINWIDLISLFVFIAEALIKIVGFGFLFPPAALGANYAAREGGSATSPRGAAGKKMTTNAYGAYYESGDEAEDIIEPDGDDSPMASPAPRPTIDADGANADAAARVHARNRRLDVAGGRGGAGSEPDSAASDVSPASHASGGVPSRRSRGDHHHDYKRRARPSVDTDVSTISGADSFVGSSTPSGGGRREKHLGNWANDMNVELADDAPDDHMPDPQWGGYRDTAEEASAAEMSDRVPYIRQGWNVLDFVVVCGGIFNLAFPSMGASISGLRALRALRVIKAFRFLRSLQFILVALYRSLFYLLNVFVILWFFFVFFGLLGIQVYGGSLRRRCVMPESVALSLTGDDQDHVDWTAPAPTGFTRYAPETFCSPVDDPKGFTCPDLGQPHLQLTCVDVGENAFNGLVSFDNIGWAGLTTFIVASLEGWSDIMYSTMDAEYGISWVYFVMLVIVINFGGINTFTSVVCSEFVDTSRALARQKLRERDPEAYGMPAKAAEPAKKAHKSVRWLQDMFDSNKRAARKSRPSDATTKSGSRPSDSSYDGGAVVPFAGAAAPVAEVEGLAPPPRPSQGAFVSVEGTPKSAESSAGKDDDASDDSNVYGDTPLHRRTREAYEEEAASMVFCVGLRMGCMRAWGPCRRLLKPIVRHKYFDNFIISCIVVNSIALALEAHNMDSDLRSFLDVFENVFAAVFMVEMVVKLIAAGGIMGYLSVSQNVFDGAIVMTSVVSLLQPLFIDEGSAGEGSSLAAVSALRVFRLFRVFRIARLLHKVRGLKELLDTVLYSVNAVISVSFFIAFTTVCGAIITTQLFGRPRAPDGVDPLSSSDDAFDAHAGFGLYAGAAEPRLHFDTFGDSIMTIFVVFSGEEWTGVLRYAAWHRGLMAFVVVLAFAFGNFVALSLFVAVIVENFETADYARQKKQELHYEVLRKRFRMNYQQAVADVLEGQDPGAALRVAYEKQRLGVDTDAKAAEPSPTGDDGPLEVVTEAEPGESSSHLGVRELSRKVSGRLHKVLTADDLKALRVTDHEPLHNRYVDDEIVSSSSDDDDEYVQKRIFSHGVGSRGALEPNPDEIAALVAVTSEPQLVREAHVKDERVRLAGSKRRARTISSEGRSSPEGKGESKRAPDAGVRKVVVFDTPPGSVDTAERNSGSRSSSPTAASRGDGGRTPTARVIGKLRAAVAATRVGQVVMASSKDRELKKLKQQVLRGERPITDLPVSIGARTEAQLLHLVKQDTSRRDAFRGRSLFIFGPISRTRRFCYKLVSHPWFERLIMLAIMVSSIFLAVETRENKHHDVFFVGDLVFLVIFTIEAAAKLIAFGGACNGPLSYLRDGWNVLDAVVLLAAYGSTITAAAGIDGGGSIRVLRLGRTLRPLRVVQRSPSMRVVVDAVIKGGGPLLQVVALVLFIVAIFAILGVNLFAGQMYRCNNPLATGIDDCVGWFIDSDDRNVTAVWANPTYNDLPGIPAYHFDNFAAGMHVVLDIMTREGFVEVLSAGMDTMGVGVQPERNASPGNALFFVACMCIVSFFGAELFTGVIVENYRVSDGTAFMTESQRRWAEAKVQLSQKRAPRALRPISDNKIVAWCQHLTRHPKFEPVVMLMIALNMLVLLMVHDPIDPEFENGLAIANGALLGIFTIEMIIKNISLTPGKYWRSPGDVFDGVLVIGSLLMLLEHVLPIRLPATAQLARGLRMGRLLRLVRAFKQLRLLANAMRRSVAAMLNVTALLLLTLFVGAVICVDLFADLPQREGSFGITRRANFETFPNAMLLLFRILTGEGINVIIRECQAAQGWAPVFLFFFYAIGRFVFLNLYLAFILDNFNSAVRVDNSTLGHLSGQLNKFKKLWRKVDPQCTGFMDPSLLAKFLRALGPPLGGPKEPVRWDMWFNRVRVDCNLVATSQGIPYKALLMLLPSLAQPEAALSVAERVRNEVLKEYAELTRAALIIQAMMRRTALNALLRQKLLARAQAAKKRVAESRQLSSRVTEATDEDEPANGGAAVAAGGIAGGVATASPAIAEPPRRFEAAGSATSLVSSGSDAVTALYQRAALPSPGQPSPQRPTTSGTDDSGGRARLPPLDSRPSTAPKGEGGSGSEGEARRG
mmetsp:Transcript_7919/g.28130  ORF Transcript_7919/g.28130 Transcript_7919/m.28130 type:complete len:2171 (-) Transcript_7919:130-6642(-)